MLPIRLDRLFWSQRPRAFTKETKQQTGVSARCDGGVETDLDKIAPKGIGAAETSYGGSLAVPLVDTAGCINSEYWRIGRVDEGLQLTHSPAQRGELVGYGQHHCIRGCGSKGGV